MKKVLKKNDLFICYSLNLFHFLKANDFRYLYKDRNPKTNLFYWSFERTPALDEAIQLYKEINSK